MTRGSYRRLILAALGSVVLLALSGAGSGVAAASGFTAAVAPGGQTQGGGDGQGGNGQGGNGQGTKTPELPSGVLFGIGLIPLGGALFLVWARRRPRVKA